MDSWCSAPASRRTFLKFVGFVVTLTFMRLVTEGYTTNEANNAKFSSALWQLMPSVSMNSDRLPVPEAMLVMNAGFNRTGISALVLNFDNKNYRLHNTVQEVKAARFESRKFRSNLFTLSGEPTAFLDSWRLLYLGLADFILSTKTTTLLHFVEHPLKALLDCFLLQHQYEYSRFKNEASRVEAALGQRPGPYHWITAERPVMENEGRWDFCISTYIQWNFIIDEAKKVVPDYELIPVGKSAKYGRTEWANFYRTYSLSDYKFSNLVYLAVKYGFEVDIQLREVASEIRRSLPFQNVLGQELELLPKKNLDDNTNCAMKGSTCCSIAFERQGNYFWICLPKLILIGVQKGATGELGMWLNRVPHVFRYGGEIHFFDKYDEHNFNTATSYQLEQLTKEWGNFSYPFKLPRNDMKDLNISAKSLKSSLSWEEKRMMYKDKLRRSLRGRLRISTHQVLEGVVAFEKSPSYMDRSAPFDVFNIIPGARIMVILRNPVKRLHSAYWHFCSYSKISICNAQGFRSWVLTALQDSRAKNQRDRVAVPAVRALASCLYVDYLESWFRIFNKPKAFLVLFTEEFQQSPFETLHRIEEYYGLHHYDFRAVAKQVNGYYVLNQGSKVIREASKPKGYSKLDEDIEMKTTLEKMFRPSIKRLRDFLIAKNATSSEPVILQPLPKWLGGPK